MVPSSPIAGEESQGADIMNDHALVRTRASAPLGSWPDAIARNITKTLANRETFDATATAR
jgi:hypothetical protein